MAEDNIPDLSRPQMFLFGCSLKADKKEFKVEVDDDEADHQLSLKSVCLGAEAEDQFHTVEIEGTTFDGKTTKIPLAVLKPSVLPSLSLGGFEITPPVSFRLQSGGGPVYISGQHFISLKESDDEEEENNTSPVKRPSNMASKKAPPLKKLKMDSDDDDDDEDDDDEDDSEDDEDDDDEDDDSVENDKDTPKSSIKSPKILPKSHKAAEKKPRRAEKQNGSPGKPGGSPGKAQTKAPVGGKDKSGAGPSGKAPSLNEVKNRLATAAKEGKSLPKTEQKFENYAKSSFKISDKQVVKELWKYLQTLKTEKK